jgi:hypothetical protein
LKTKYSIFGSLLFLLLFSCNSSKFGTYVSDPNISNGVGSKNIFEFKKNNKFNYYHFGDQGSSEGSGMYKIKNDSLIFKFDNTQRLINKRYVQKLKADSIIIELHNINDNTHRFSVDIDGIPPNSTSHVHSEYLLKPQDYTVFRLPKTLDTVIFFSKVQFHQSLEYIFNSKGHYIIKCPLTEGPESKITNRTMIYKIIKNTNDSLIFANDRFPHLHYKKRN